MKKKDLHGMRFGKLTAIREHGRTKNQTVIWECLCDCGNTIFVKSSDLLNGHVVSCGCSRNKYGNKPSCQTRLYRIWKNIKQRCYNPNDAEYHRYGGRNIKMCDAWLSDFGAFRDWAMDHGYSDYLSIDRIDNDLGYSPENCKWSTRFEQSNNMSCNIRLDFNGETHTLSEWGQKIGIKSHTLYTRLKSGWSIEKTLTTPLMFKEAT